MDAPAAATVADLGEFGLIAAVRPVFTPGPGVVVGPGDDAAVLSTPSAQVAVSTDLLLEDRHFRRDWSGPGDVGHKTAAANLSDLNAMGGRGSALVVGLGVPGDLPVSWVLGLAEGLAAEAGSVGASVVGGDVTAADRVVLAVTVVGACERPVRRDGARPGDVVAVCGRLGWAAAGYAVLSRGFRSPRAVVEAHRRPEPPYDAGPQAAALGATAMVDVSDGLLADLGHVAAGSGVTIDVRSAAFEPPEPLRAVGAALGLDPRGLMLTGGDDYGLAATFPPGTALPPAWTEVGTVERGEASVTVDGSAYQGEPGHQHFR